MREINNDRRTEEDLKRRWAGILRDSPTPDNFQKAYNEVHRFFLEKGMPTRAKPADGTLYGTLEQKSTLSFRRILKLIGRNKRILEIGCADGHLSYALARNGNFVFGSDVSKVAINNANKLYRDKIINEKLNLSFMVTDARNIGLLSECFDYVVSIDTVEHLLEKDLDLHLHEVNRVLKNGGRYVFLTPNAAHDPCFKFQRSQGLDLQFYRLGQIAEALRRNNWISVYIYHLASVKLPISLAVYIDNLLSRIKVPRRLAPFLHPWIFVSAKAPSGLHCREVYRSISRFNRGEPRWIT